MIERLTEFESADGSMKSSSELSSPSLAFQRWLTQPEVEVQVSDWGKDACPICASDFHLDRRSAVSCDCGGACQVWGGKTRPRHEIHPKI